MKPIQRTVFIAYFICVAFTEEFLNSWNIWKNSDLRRTGINWIDRYVAYFKTVS
jgi:hypothetical protein